MLTISSHSKETKVLLSRFPFNSLAVFKVALERMRTYAIRLIDERRKVGSSEGQNQTVSLLDLIMEHSDEESDETKLTDVEVPEITAVQLQFNHFRCATM